MSSRPRIALATCSSLPSWEHDDEPLLAALRERGAEVAQPIWDDPSVDWSAHDLVVIRTTWDYQSKHAAFVAWAEGVAARTRLLNPPAVVGWNTDKRYLRGLAAAGVPIAPSWWFAQGDSPDLAELVAAAGIVRGFVKPVVAANSRGTFRFDARDPVALAAAQASLTSMLAGEAMVLQPYLAAVEQEGELSVVVFDGAVSHAVRKVPVAGDYRVQDDFGAHDEPLAVDAELADLVERTLTGLAQIAAAQGWADALPLAYARVDVLRDGDGALVVNELELVEPSLFFRHDSGAGARFAEVLLRRIARDR